MSSVSRAAAAALHLPAAAGCILACHASPSGRVAAARWLCGGCLTVARRLPGGVSVCGVQISQSAARHFQAKHAENRSAAGAARCTLMADLAPSRSCPMSAQLGGPCRQTAIPCGRCGCPALQQAERAPSAAVWRRQRGLSSRRGLHRVKILAGALRVSRPFCTAQAAPTALRQGPAVVCLPGGRSLGTQLSGRAAAAGDDVGQLTVGSTPAARVAPGSTIKARRGGAA